MKSNTNEIREGQEKPGCWVTEKNPGKTLRNYQEILFRNENHAINKVCDKT